MVSDRPHAPRPSGPAGIDIAAVQRRSAGNSTPAIHEAALAASAPAQGLSWLDIGAGTGDLLRAILNRYAPAALCAVDVLPWLDGDLAEEVQLHVGDALVVLPTLPAHDRVMMVECLEHLESPWSALRLAARLVKPGGRIVITTPNVRSLRHRLELALRGQLTSFRPQQAEHLTPALAHVIERILAEEGLEAIRRGYAGRDIVPLTGGRLWPQLAHDRARALTSVSLLVCAERRVRNDAIDALDG
jgi:2-polyprenyl-3-methyl-5-hydroxy-6-metoxy-1,4-benzoquinol methylase